MVSPLSYKASGDWYDVKTRLEMNSLPVGAVAYCREDGRHYIIAREAIDKSKKPTPLLVWERFNDAP